MTSQFIYTLILRLCDTSVQVTLMLKCFYAPVELRFILDVLVLLVVLRNEIKDFLDQLFVLSR